MIQRLPDCCLPEFVHFSPDALRERPELAARVMEAIGIWSHCDAMRTQMLTTMLKADFKVVTKMMVAIEVPPAISTARE